MTNRLGCELNNRIAAIASVSGTIGSGITCNPSRVVPACHFHGTADQVIAYNGNMFGNDPEALVAYWASHDHCSSTPSTIDTLPHVAADSLHVIHYVYPNGLYGSDVEFYKVLNGQHQWLGPTGEDINYAVAIWNFFNKHKWVAQAPNGVNSIAQDLGISLYPNPASMTLTLNVPGAGSELKGFTITDLSGRPVYTNTSQSNMDNDLSIDVSGLARGVYIMQIKVGDKTVNKKFCLVD